MSEVKTQEFQRASARAVLDPKLRKALKGMGGFDQARQRAIQDIGPEVWEDLRNRARQIKHHTLENLDYYLAMLADRVTQAGGVVHFAKDAREANTIVAEVARSRNVRLITKSKSMVSEEMGLNHLLEEMGIEVVESDLGEFIIQLARETPSHIIAPAMHKSKEEVGDLFQRHLAAQGLESIEDMARTARRVLRDKFLKADMGITGANFMVAETGTIMLVTNEGNGRFCTSAPRIQVTIAGMEKVVPSLEDLSVFIRLLPRAATGQRITSYTTFVTGPRRPEDEDGPEEFHLIIVDNGRSRLLRDPELREALYCIRCGACLNTCPVYRNVGGHAYGWVYSGPIGAVVTPMLVGLPKAKDLPYASSLCGACREVCPIKINIPHMLLKLRHRLVESPLPQERKTSLMESLTFKVWYQLMTRPRLMGAFRAAGRVLQAPLARQGRIRRLPIPPFSRWTRARDLPALPKETFRQIWAKRLSSRE